MDEVVIQTPSKSKPLRVDKENGNIATCLESKLSGTTQLDMTDSQSSEVFSKIERQLFSSRDENSSSSLFESFRVSRGNSNKSPTVPKALDFGPSFTMERGDQGFESRTLRDNQKSFISPPRASRNTAVANTVPNDRVQAAHLGTPLDGGTLDTRKKQEGKEEGTHTLPLNVTGGATGSPWDRLFSPDRTPMKPLNIRSPSYISSAAKPTTVTTPSLSSIMKANHDNNVTVAGISPTRSKANSDFSKQLERGSLLFSPPSSSPNPSSSILSPPRGNGNRHSPSGSLPSRHSPYPAGKFNRIKLKVTC